MMQVRKLGLPGLFEIVSDRIDDERGFFSEIWNAAHFREADIAIDWVQDNYSFSATSHVLRGLHYQKPPAAQDKLVRVVHGSVFDVAVDIRHNSPSFGKWVSLELSADRWNEILVPKGFAHGFLTLTPATQVLYKVSAPYSPEHYRRIRFDDPQIGVDWPLGGSEPLLSPEDKAAPRLAEVDTGFWFA